MLFQPDYICGSYAYITADRFAKLAPIMTRWMCDIRTFMDELAAKTGKPRMCFGVRVPETPEIARNIGIDLPAWIHEAELDYIVPSGFHATHFNIPVQQFKAICEGEYDHLPEQAFLLVGGIEEAVENAKKMEAAA